MGASIITRRRVPHLLKALCFLLTSSACTLLNLNRRKPRNTQPSVSSSIKAVQKNSDCVSPAYKPAVMVSVSNRTTMPSANTTAKTRMVIKWFLVSFISSYFSSNNVRLVIDRPSVTSSAYSSSLPTAMPRAITLTFMPVGASFR